MTVHVKVITLYGMLKSGVGKLASMISVYTFICDNAFISLEAQTQLVCDYIWKLYGIYSTYACLLTTLNSLAAISFMCSGTAADMMAGLVLRHTLINRNLEHCLHLHITYPTSKPRLASGRCSVYLRKTLSNSIDTAVTELGGSSIFISNTCGRDLSIAG